MPRPTIKHKIEFPSILYSVGSCVYKLWYGSKYIFVKAKNCAGSLKMIQDSLNQFMKGSEAQRKPDNLYLHFFNYYARNKTKAFRVEVLSSPGDTDYNLLVLEDRLVSEARNDTKCLNNINGAYINQWNEETQSYNWLSRPAVANFTRNRKKNAPRKRSAISGDTSSASTKKSSTKKATARKKVAKKGKAASVPKSKSKGSSKLNKKVAPAKAGSKNKTKVSAATKGKSAKMPKATSAPAKKAAKKKK
jgi:hypothetical protein